ncbi:unnamed protein product [Closterium sp. Naga37s-1]|nr:unnamed protein product [Closterium sp. Naga37s-1]
MGVRSISCEAAEPFDGATLALLLSSSAPCAPGSTGSAAPSSGSPASAIPRADSGNTTEISATSSSNVTATTYSSSNPVPANATATSDSGSSDSVTLFALAVAAVLASVSRSPGGNIDASESRGSGPRREEGRGRGSGGSREAERGGNRGEGGRQRRGHGHRQGQVGRRVGSHGHGEVGEGGKGGRREAREVVGSGGREEGRCCGCGKKERAGGRIETTGTRGADGALLDVLVPIVTQGRNGQRENEENQPEAVRVGEGEGRDAAGRNVQVDFSTRSVHEAVPEARGASENPEGGASVWKPNDTRADIGFKAARRIEAGEVILIIPRRFFIVANWIALNESERHLLPYDMQLPVPYGWDTYTVLAAWLLRERAKGAASPWALFLRSLPAYVPLPALFPQSLIDQFEYWPIVDQATRLKAAYADLYDRCNSSNPAAIANATRSEFYWALTIVTSRCFTFSPALRSREGGEEQQAEGAEGAEGDGDGSAVGADGEGWEVRGMAGEGWEVRGMAGDHFLFATYEAIEKGEPLSISYGPSPASLLSLTSAPPLPARLPHPFPPRQLSGDHFLFATYQAIEKGEPLSISGPLPLHHLPSHRERRAPEHIAWSPAPFPPSFPPLQLSGDHFLFTTYQPIEKGEPLSISYGAKPTIDMVSAALPQVSAALPQVSAALPQVSAALPQVSAALPQVSAALPQVAALVREVVVRMREEKQTGVQGQGQAEEEGEGQEAQGGEAQEGEAQEGEVQGEGVQDGMGGEGTSGDGVSGDGSTDGEWWEGMEGEEEEFESAKKQLVVWAGGHVSPEMLAMAAAVWHFMNTGRELDAEQLARAAMHLSAPILDNGKPFTDDDYAADDGAAAADDDGADDGDNNGDNVGAAAEEAEADSHGTEDQESGSSTADEPHDMAAQAADTWQQLAQSTSADILSALSEAACAIQQRVRALMGVGLTGEEKRQAAREASEAESGKWSFSTDYYEDEDQLRELVACRGGRYRSASEILAGSSGKGRGEAGESREGEVEAGEQTHGSASGSAGGLAGKLACSPGVMRWVHERETVLQFRMVKKSILSEADVEMGEWCRSMGRAAS